MAHESDTQATSDDMPKVPHTILRNGVYYLNFRNPDRLVKAGLAKSHFKKSLRTKDREVAKSKVSREVALRQAENDRLLRELDGKSELHDRAIEAGGTVPLSSLTKDEQRDLVLGWFVELEAREEQFREEVRESQDLDFIDRSRDVAREELAFLEGTGPFPPVDWEKDFTAFLKRKGFTFDPDREDAGLLKLFKKAVIESHWRTVQSFDRGEYQHRDPAFSELHAASRLTQPTRRKKTRTVAELCEEYRQAKIKSGRSPATLKSYNTRFAALQGAVGAETDLSALDDQLGGDAYEAGKKIVNFLATIPPYAPSRYKGRTLAEACRLESAKANPQFIEPKTQRDHFIDIKAILSFAVKRHWLSRNPLDGLEDSLPPVRELPRETLSGSELTALFSTPEFLREKDAGENGSGRFWCVILCLFHGMRLNEAASLLVSDVKKEGGIWFLDFTEYDDEGEKVKRLKTKSSRRRVPLHEEAIKIGFLELVEERKLEGGEPWLFPDLKANSIGNRGTYTSRWFARIRDKHLGKPKRPGDKGIHSFRHTVADAIRGITESDEILFAIGGWGSKNRENSSRRYGKGDLKRLKRVVDQIALDGFDPSSLYPGRNEK